MFGKIKKPAILLVAICMIVSMMPRPPLSVFAETEGTGMEGTGTAEEPYQITTEAELKEIWGFDYYKLMNDIVLTEEWTPIFSFGGTLDGNGKTISGLNVSRMNGRNGFIESLASGGMVKDLTVYGSITCLNTGNCGGDGTGGIVGYNGGTITGCEFHGTASQIQGDNMCVAGIAGYNNGVISHCKSYGDITGISTGGSYKAVFVGGITGSDHGTLEISNCANYGTIFGSVPNTNTYVGEIWGSNSWEYQGAYVGGITGDTEGDNAPKDCSNEGAVVGENANAEAVALTGITSPKNITLSAPVSEAELSTRPPLSVVLETAGGNRVGTVVWNTDGYNLSTGNATYTFVGTVTLPSTVKNDNSLPLTTTITVTVGGGSVTPPTEDIDYALYFEDGKLYKADVYDPENITIEGEYAEQTDKWSADGNTLTLKGLEFETIASRGLVMSDGTTLSLQGNTESTLTTTATGGCGIQGKGSLVISGGGTVKANGTYGILHRI